MGGIIQGADGNGYNTGFRILDYNNKPLAQINFGDSEPIRILGEPFIQDEWFHIVLTYDHENIKLYENAELVAEKPETRDINWSDDNDLNLYIGWAQWYFTGIIDKAMLFDFALNAQDVQELYNTSNPGNSPPTF